MTELQGISTILAIRLARLGDVTLLLPALGSLKNSFPEASLTLMTGSPYASVGELCPWVDDVISVDRLAMRDAPKHRALVDIVRLVRKLRARRFDLVVDFHSFRETNLLTWASGARYRVGMKRSDRAYLGFCFNLPPAPEDKDIHVAEMFQRIVQALPGARITSNGGSTIHAPASGALPLSDAMRPVVVFYVGASVSGRRWPPERFSALIRYVAENWKGSQLILGGVSPEEQSIVKQIASGVGDLPAVRALGNLTIPQIAAVLGSSDILVSNDTGPMHLGSALGIPTLGIFSQSLPKHYRPVGRKDRYIRKECVTDIRTEDVAGVLEEMRAALRNASPGRQP